MSDLAANATSDGERRNGQERRVADRRRVNIGAPTPVARRKIERRSGADRRRPS